jgi:hypothetical protein
MASSESRFLILPWNKILPKSNTDVSSVAQTSTSLCSFSSVSRSRRSRDLATFDDHLIARAVAAPGGGCEDVVCSRRQCASVR